MKRLIFVLSALTFLGCLAVRGCAKAAYADALEWWRFSAHQPITADTYRALGKDPQ